MADAKETVLITGANGFLGRALAARLSRSYRVVGLDLQKPRQPQAGVESEALDLTSDGSVRRALARALPKGTRVASVIHLAAYYDLTGEEDPRYRSVTVEGTRRLLRSLAPYRPQQFVFASTLLVHAPTAPGQPLDEASPVEPAWPYPQSKADTEAVIRRERGEIPAVILRLAGVYTEDCRSAFLAQQIARIYEKHPLSYVFAGEASHGQASLHLEDMLDAVERTVERRAALPDETVLLIGEATGPSYEALQARIGEILHGEPWPAWSLPKEAAQAGAWIQEELLDQDGFIKPWMIDISDHHYEIDGSRARRLLDWKPKHDLMATLPAMLERLQRDPPGWYRLNKLNAAKVADSDAVIEKAKRRLERPQGAGAEAAARRVEAQRRATLWAPVASIALGAWLVASPFLHGLFDPLEAPSPPPAAGHPLAPAASREAWLGWSELLSGVAVVLLACLTLARRGWAAWAQAGLALWIVTAPLVFWTGSAAAYSSDTLVGTLLFAFAVLIPPPPGIASEALASRTDIPLGWSYSPSTYVQRLPIVALACIGFFVSRYLAAYQMGHVESLWDPLFDGEAGLNGSEAVVTSSISKSFPIPDAGLGAVAYLMDVLTGVVGDRRRWRTMPWMVLAFGLLVIPLAAVSVGFIMLQPTVIGTLCTLCLLQAAITVFLIPYALDEVLASLQYLWDARRAGLPFWRTFFRGGPPLAEARDENPDLPAPAGSVLRQFLTGGVTYPWSLLACTAIGAWLIAMPQLLALPSALADSHHLVGCIAVTLAVTAYAAVGRPVRLLNVPLGLWVAASPFLLGDGGTLVLLLSVASGLGLALLSLPRGDLGRDHYGSWDRWIV